MSEKTSLGKAGLAHRLLRLVTRFEDGAILRAAFLIMLAGAVVMLWLDYKGLQLDALDQPMVLPQFEPILPAVDRPELDPSSPAFAPLTRIKTDPVVLRQPMNITLTPGGVLWLEGSIVPGTIERFNREIAARGEYVETIALNSPGGDVNEALAIGRAIRLAGFDTYLGDGQFCGSSCPLIFAAGVNRLAAEHAAIGVHQVYAENIAEAGAAQALSDAQVATAAITRYLGEMGIDPALWLLALETPPDKLYYLTPQDLRAYRLTTSDASL